METLVVKLSPEAYQAWRERAIRENKSIEALSSEVLEKALAEESDGALTVREILEAAGRVASLGPGLKQHIIPGVSLEEVRESLARAGGPSLKGRGPSGMSIQARDRALSRLFEDSERSLILLQVDRTVIDQAVALVFRHRLRAYDAVQLATAIVVNAQLVEHGYSSLTFVTADRDLLGAAGGEGLAVENPLDHCDI